MKNHKITTFSFAEWKRIKNKYDLKKAHVSINGENETVTVKLL